MGRHTLSHIAAQQTRTTGKPPCRCTSAYVGRVGLLAVAFGIGAAVAGGTALAGAETPSSNAGDDRPSVSSTQSPTRQDSATDSRTDTTSTRSAGRQATESGGQDAQDEASDDTGAIAGRARADDDPGSAPATSLEAVNDPPVDAAEVDPQEAPAGEQPAAPSPSPSTTATVSVAPPTTTPEAAPAQRRSARTSGSPAAPALTVLEVLPAPGRELPSSSASTSIESIAPVVPSPADQATTEYGDIGKWMLQWNGKIADYGGVPYQGKTVLEAVNVVIVDPTSKSALGATWRLNAAMRRAGFPPRLIHSTGFRGIIDDQRYRQQPRGLLVGYSDDFFLVDNNHGRIFGPDPVETSSGYVWSGAFSTEEFGFFGGLPRHAYVSSNMARDALAADLVASGRARLGGTVALDNAYNTDTTTTGDHDGYAVVVILQDPYAVGATSNAAMLVGAAATNNGTCVAAGYSAHSSAHSPCAAVAITAATQPR